MRRPIEFSIFGTIGITVRRNRGMRRTARLRSGECHELLMGTLRNVCTVSRGDRLHYGVYRRRHIRVLRSADRMKWGIRLAAATIVGAASMAAGEPRQQRPTVEQLAAKLPEHLLTVSDLHDGVDFLYQAFLKSDGSQPAGDYQDGELTGGASKYLTLHIPDGEDTWFNFSVMCDDNCAGIELEARNAAGEITDSSSRQPLAADAAQISLLSTADPDQSHFSHMVLKNTDEVIGIHISACKASACKYSLRMYKATNADFLKPTTEGILRQICAASHAQRKRAKNRGASVMPDACRHR